jgi:hypothetical protein
MSKIGGKRKSRRHLAMSQFDPTTERRLGTSPRLHKVIEIHLAAGLIGWSFVAVAASKIGHDLLQLAILFLELAQPLHL